MNGRIEIRELTPGGPLELSGHAATFNQPYMVGGMFEETIRPGAFKRSLGEGPDVSLLVNHGGLPLARTKSGTMTLTEDARGLHVRAELEPTDPEVQALVPKMKRGDLSEMSFAFKATDQEWSKAKDKRYVLSAGIHKGDVSIVTSAANPNATATVRAQDLTLEQRERIAERVGDRICGPYEAEAERSRSTATHASLTPRGFDADRASIQTARASSARLRAGGKARSRPRSVVGSARTEAQRARARRAWLKAGHPHRATPPPHELPK
jgi:HK97 family phage prohead protease